MPILNYTTKVNVFDTMATIQAKLVSHGARKILQEYDETGRVEAMSFTIVTSTGEKGIRLPANAEAVMKVLHRQKVKCDRAQAERVAWRIIKDWVEAQMAILEAEMVSMEEIFFPYMLQGEQTFFKAYQEQQARLMDGKE